MSMYGALQGMDDAFREITNQNDRIVFTLAHLDEFFAENSTDKDETSCAKLAAAFAERPLWVRRLVDIALELATRQQQNVKEAYTLLGEALHELAKQRKAAEQADEQPISNIVLHKAGEQVQDATKVTP